MRPKQRPRKIIKVQLFNTEPKNNSSTRFNASRTDLFAASDEHLGKNQYQSSPMETASDQTSNAKNANYKIFKDLSMDFASFTKTKPLTKAKKK